MKVGELIKILETHDKNKEIEIRSGRCLFTPNNLFTINNKLCFCNSYNFEYNFTQVLINSHINKF